jgi:hypothetical protein
MIRRMFLFALVLACLSPASAQKPPVDGNPFELAHRLPKRLADGRVAPRGNPFEVMPHRAPGPNLRRAAGVEQPFRPGKFLPRGRPLPKAAVFWVLVGIFAFLTFSIAVNRTAVGRAWRGFLSDNSLALAQREASGLVGSTPYFLLYGNFLLNAGMFIFLVGRYLKGDSVNNLSFLLLCIAAAFVVFLSKHLMLGLLRWLFRVDAEVGRYNFLIIIFNCVLGLFLVPFNFLMAFAGPYLPFLVFWTLGLTAIFYIYRSIRAGRIGLKYLATDQFHFLLYLCVVEIAPVLFLIKLATLPSGS